MPLPKAIAESAIIEAVAPLKDVDGSGRKSRFADNGLAAFLAVHSARVAADSGAEQHPHRRAARGDRGPQQHRRQTAGVDAYAEADGANATVTVSHSKTRDIGA